MHRLQFAKGTRLAATALVALALAACGDDGPEPVQLTAQNAPVVGDLTVSLLENALSGLTASAINPGGYTGITPAVGSMRGRNPLINFSMNVAPDGCPSFSPDPAPDADQDGVPDNTLYTFDPAFCTTTDQNGTLVITGSIRVSDPASAQIGFDIDINTLGIDFQGAQGQGDFNLGLDGSRSLRGSPSLLTLDDDLGLSATVGNETATVGYTWSVSFTPAQGSSIVFGDALPDGILDLGGSFTANSSEGFFNLVIDTPTGLTFDPACGLEGDVVAGVARAAASSQQGAAAVEVTWNGCGVEPTVVFVGSNA